LWGIDCQTGGISPLPASPLLLPAIIVSGILWVISKLWPEPVKTQPIPDNFNQEEWDRNYSLYHKLVAKRAAGIELTASESIQLRYYLPRPSWAKPGEYWTY
jgi:hypothetical protein